MGLCILKFSSVNYYASERKKRQELGESFDGSNVTTSDDDKLEERMHLECTGTDWASLGLVNISICFISELQIILYIDLSTITYC